MNTQQYKHFKEGDNVLVYGVVESVGIGDVLISLTLANGEKNRVWVSMNRVGAAWARPSDSPSSPAPCASKHDPHRLFKKGDRVQVKKRNGRCNGKNGEYLREAFCEVAEDEVPNELVRVYHNSSEYLLDPAYLELVTPVDELEPYYVKDDGTHYVVGKRPEEPEIVYLAEYSKDRHPHAKEAAEAERDRLNAEHRKGQNNGNQ